MITKLSDINCSRFQANLSTDLRYFNVDKFLKDNPLRKGDNKKNFLDGKLAFARIIVLEKADYHIHWSINIAPTKSSKKLRIGLEFCLNKIHDKSKTKKLPKGSYFKSFERFFQWLGSYFTDFSKIEVGSHMTFNFNKDKYKSLLELPFKITIPTIEKVELGEVNISGLRLDFKGSKVGIDYAVIDLFKEYIYVIVSNPVRQFEENYFDNIFEVNSKFVKIFIKESK